MPSSFESQLPPNDDRGPLVLGWVWTTTILAIIGVILRGYVRFNTRAIGVDDYTIFIATIVTIFGSIINQVMVDYGFGRHTIYVHVNVEHIVMWTIIAEIQSYFAVGMTKISVCWFILRMIRGTHKLLKSFIIILMVVLCTMILVAMLLVSLQCFPLQRAWNRKLEGVCMSKHILTRFTEAIGVIGCITDFACVSIPIFLIRGLNMNRRTKIALIIILSFGIVPGACAIGKSITTNFESEDPTYDFVPVLIFTVVECNFGIFVACLPALRPLFHAILKGTTLRSKPSNQHLSPRSGIRQNIFGRSSRSTGTFLSLDDHSASNKAIPMGKIEVSHTLNIDSELGGSRDEDAIKPCYRGATN